MLWDSAAHLFPCAEGKSRKINGERAVEKWRYADIKLFPQNSNEDYSPHRNPLKPQKTSFVTKRNRTEPELLLWLGLRTAGFNSDQRRFETALPRI